MGTTVDPAAAARAVRRAGRMLAIGLLLGPAVDGARAEAELLGGALWAAAFASCGAVLLLAGAGLLDRLFLRDLSARVHSGNLAAGVLTAGNAVALGVLTRACFGGGRDVTALAVSGAFFGLAFLTVLLLQALFRRRTHYADDQEVVGENVAAALAHAGVTVAFAIIVGHAADGEFVGWLPSLAGYARALVLALALIPVRTLIVRRALLGLPRGDARALDRAVAGERDVAVGAIEALAYVAVALLVTGVA